MDNGGTMVNRLVVFKGKEIRRVLHNNEWWFSVVDIVTSLTDSNDSRQYIKRMRKRDTELNSYWGTICTPLVLKAPDGRMRKTNCANTEGLFRIIQSIPSLKAEPFKRWLAKVGYERVLEIEDPELASKRIPKVLMKIKPQPERAGKSPVMPEAIWKLKRAGRLSVLRIIWLSRKMLNDLKSRKNNREFQYGF